MDRTAFDSLSIKPVEVQVPEWNNTVHVRLMSGPERFAWVKFVSAHEDDSVGFQVQMLIRTMCDEQGNRLFTDSDDDAAAVAALPATIIDRLNRAAMKLNVVGDEGQAEVKND